MDQEERLNQQQAGQRAQRKGKEEEERGRAEARPKSREWEIVHNPLLNPGIVVPNYKVFWPHTHTHEPTHICTCTAHYAQENSRGPEIF